MEAGPATKERALNKLAPMPGTPIRYRAGDKLLPYSLPPDYADTTKMTRALNHDETLSLGMFRHPAKSSILNLPLVAWHDHHRLWTVGTRPFDGVADERTGAIQTVHELAVGHGHKEGQDKAQMDR